jgi:hypothetical protein
VRRSARKTGTGSRIKRNLQVPGKKDQAADVAVSVAICPWVCPGPDELVVGDAGYIDGWVVVIGPAQGYTGAAYRIRYQVAEPYLQGKRTGGYYDGEEDDE